MTRLILLAPIALAACGTPCPVPRECITPEWCVCLVTGAVDPLPDGDGWEPAPAAQPTTPPDHNGGPTKDDHGPGNGGGSHTSDHNGGDSGSSDENGGKS